MKEVLAVIIHISRPRFWLYLAGPYLVGYAAGITKQTDFFSLQFVLHFLYFLIPANIFLYGINDVFDSDTDATNIKKGKQEHRLALDQKKFLSAIIIFVLFFSLLFLITQKTLIDQSLFLFFLLLGVFYSAPPLRLKSIPFFDFSSNVLYAIPGFLAYHQISGSLPPLFIMLSAFCWTSAMHLLSAIPDIVPDKKAHIKTTAVYLEKNSSLLLCVFLWGVSALLIQFSPLYPWTVLAFIYPVIPLLALFKKIDITTFYWRFPVITFVLGMLLFFLIFLSKPYA